MFCPVSFIASYNHFYFCFSSTFNSPPITLSVFFTGFSLRYVATMLFSALRLYEILSTFISSFIKSFNKFIMCCFSVSVICFFTFASKIGLEYVCDLISTVTFLLVSTSKSLSQGVKNVSSAITSKRILPEVSSSINPFNFLIGISHFPDLEIVPLNSSE